LPQSPSKTLSSLYTPSSLIIFVPQGGRYHYGQFLMKEPNKKPFLKTPKKLIEIYLFFICIQKIFRAEFFWLGVG
jgi:hypothetical protein